MSQNKIKFGVDLGTTNSGIARIEKGIPTIEKTDSLKDTMPSCVGFNRKGALQVGDQALNKHKSEKLRALRGKREVETNTFVEFKRTMGSEEKYYSTYKDREFSSEELSAEVLKKLRSFIDEEFHSVVVTVPAKFEIVQKDATHRAAKLAGFKQCELLQEPIAASMAYGLSNDINNGYWIVFDFGGGTFDAALVKVEDGIMQVKDTEGDNHLGGKNLDQEIVEEIIIPFIRSEYSIDSILDDEYQLSLLKKGMKQYAEEAKIQLSFKDEFNILTDLGEIPRTDDDGEEIMLDITVSRDELADVISPIFQRAIDITKGLLERNNLSGESIDSLILVGGPTHSPILRQMLSEQIRNPDTSSDPMTAVATGAALYASTVDVSDEVKETTKDKSKIQLDIQYESQTVETEEWITIRPNREQTEGEVPEELFAEIIRGDNGWTSGRKEIKDKGEIIEVQLSENKPNSYNIKIYDQGGNQYSCQPNEITIIQGSKTGSATLPDHIGIEIRRKKDSRLVFMPAEGLKKNQSLPATGVINNLKTQQRLRPGNKEDFIKIPIYQGEYGSEGTRAILNKHVYDVKITGDNMPSLLPKGSSVDLTLRTDNSGRVISMEAFFPQLDVTHEVDVPEGVSKMINNEYLENEIHKALKEVRALVRNRYVDTTKINNIKGTILKLKQRYEQAKNEYERKQEVLNRLREVLKEIDEIKDGIEWPQLEESILRTFSDLDKAQKEFGDQNTQRQIDKFREQFENIKQSKNVPTGESLLERMTSLYVDLTRPVLLVQYVNRYSENFNNYNWADKEKARYLLNNAKELIKGVRNVDDVPVNKLGGIVAELIDLLDEREKPGPSDRELLTR